MKLRRILASVLAGVMVISLLSACGQAEDAGTSAESTSEVQESAENAVPESEEQEKVEASEEAQASQEVEETDTEAPVLTEEEIAALYEADGYHLLWHDEFDGTELNLDNWTVEEREPGWTNNELQAYVNSEENVYVEDGKLVLKANKGKDAKGLTAYTSGKVNSKSKRQFLYGKVVVRAKVPAGQGLWPAIWMMPQDESFYGQWPKCGEIDIMEILGNQTKILYSNIHYGLPHGESQGTYTLDTSFSKDYHEFGLEWEPDEMRFFVDGQLFHTVNNWYTAVEGEDEVTYPAPFDQPFFVQMNLAVGGDWPGDPDGTTDFDKAKLSVDYVRVYQKDEYDTNVVKPSSMLREPDENGNYIFNGDFAEQEALDDVENWQFLLFEGGSGSAAIENGEVIVTSKAAGNQDYSVQLLQAKVPVEQGGVYKVTFEGKAEEEREIKVAVTAPDNAWIRYLPDTSLTLGTDWQEYEYTFTMENENDSNSRLEFNMGNQGSTATVSLRNIKMEKTGTVEVASNEGEKSIQSDGNYVYNGTFQYGDGRMKYWTVENNIEGAVVEVTNLNLIRQLHTQVPEGAAQLDAIKVKQSDLALVSDTMYNLMFDAYGDKQQTIQVQVGSETFEATLTDTLTNYSFSFSLPAGEEKPDLAFLLGAEGNVCIDNVKVKEDGAIINASFANGFTGWEPFVDSAISADVTYAVDSLAEDDAAGYTINNTGEQNWQIQLMQKNISLYKGKKYKLSFDAKCTMDRSIECAAQRNGSQDDIWTEYGINSFDLTSEYQTFVLEFEMTEENNLAAMITFSMGAINGEVITDSHVIFIDNVVLEEM